MESELRYPQNWSYDTTAITLNRAAATWGMVYLTKLPCTVGAAWVSGTMIKACFHRYRRNKSP
jgi:hypothetical protein